MLDHRAFLTCSGLIIFRQQSLIIFFAVALLFISVNSIGFCIECEITTKGQLEEGQTRLMGNEQD